MNLDELKPITPGCLVYVRPGNAHSEIAGKTFMAEEVIPRMRGACRHCSATHAWSLKDSGGWKACACVLIRIDPDEDDAKMFEAESRSEGRPVTTEG